MKKNESFYDSLEKAVYGSKTYEEFIQDATVMQRLIHNLDFLVYRRLMIEAYAALIARMKHSPLENLPGLQGAISQHEILMKLPEKVVETATNLVENKREEAKTGEYK